MAHPKLSVVMPVHNSANYLAEAVESILNQKFEDFELIVIDDGSTDRSPEIIEKYKKRDLRIRTLTFPQNRGNYPARNAGNSMVTGEYICVMDSDDIALPERLAFQYEFMEDNPDVGLAGSDYLPFNRVIPDFVQFPDYEIIKIRLMASNIFCHPTLILRKKYLDQYNLAYNENYTYAADYDFITRVSMHFRITLMEEVLLKYRLHSEQISSRFFYAQQFFTHTIIINYIEKTLGIALTEEEKEIHYKLMQIQPIEDNKTDKVIEWVKKLLSANALKGYFDQNTLKLFLVGKLKNMLGQF